MLVAGARKELAYLDQFGLRRAPYKGLQRYCYHNEKQELSDRAKNLDRYLLLAPSLVPDNDFLMTFCLCHPDFNQHQQFQSFERFQWLTTDSQLIGLATRCCPTPLPPRRYALRHPERRGRTTPCPVVFAPDEIDAVEKG